MKQWWLWVLTGVVSILGGALALANPFAAAQTAEQLTGWTFLISGILVLAVVFREKAGADSWPAIVMGGVMLLLGVFLIADPLAGLVSLSMAVAVTFVVGGLSRTWMAVRDLQGGMRATLLCSGGLSAVLGVLIISNFPLSVLVLLGLLMAVELLSNGVSLVLLGLMQKRVETALPDEEAVELGQQGR